jgi:hypothetical protein
LHPQQQPQPRGAGARIFIDDPPFLRALDQTVTVTKGWSEAYGLFLKGESDLVLSYTTSPAYHMIFCIHSSSPSPGVLVRGSS